VYPDTAVSVTAHLRAIRPRAAVADRDPEPLKLALGFSSGGVIATLNRLVEESEPVDRLVSVVFSGGALSAQVRVSVALFVAATEGPAELRRG
jgi:hypothetical protein